jgi:hypothetical protein
VDTEIDAADLADTIHAAGEDVPADLTAPSERFQRVPNRVMARNVARAYGERRPERSRLRRLSRKERLWRR